MAWIDIKERESDGVVVLAPALKLSSPGGNLLFDRVQQLVHDGRRKIVVSLADAPYLSSAELGEIVNAYTVMTRAGGVLKLCAVPPRILKLLETHQVRRFFDVFESEQEAVASFDEEST